MEETLADDPKDRALGDAFADTLARALSDLGDHAKVASDSGYFSQEHWSRFRELGGMDLLLTTATGNSSTPRLDSYARVAKRLGQLHVPFPAIESMVAQFLLTQATHSPIEGVLTVAFAKPDPSADADAAAPPAATHSMIRATQVPWGRVADAVVLIEAGADASAAAHVSIATRDEIAASHAQNLAGEARDSLLIKNRSVLSNAFRYDTLVALLALGRAAQICGALETVTRMTVSYVSEREQFGRTLSRFQAIQHALARIYAEAVAANVAVNAALRGSIESLNPFATAAAIVRCRDAATRVAAQAHQAHGAMGFTEEYPLAAYSRRLWAWRDEYESQAAWTKRLGKMVVDDERPLIAQLTAADV